MTAKWMPSCILIMKIINLLEADQIVCQEKKGEEVVQEVVQEVEVEKETKETKEKLKENTNSDYIIII